MSKRKANSGTFNGYKYKIDRSNKGFDVYEKNTESVIKTFPNDLTEARKFAFQLDQGGAFDGWTPSFFNISVQPVIDNLWVEKELTPA